MIPITNDQPGVSARVQRFGAGALLPLKQLSTVTLHDYLISTVMTDASYRQSAHKCAEQIKRIDGPARAAELIEQAFETRGPVPSARPPRRSSQHRAAIPGEPQITRIYTDRNSSTLSVNIRVIRG